MMTKRFALPDTLPDPYFTIDAGEARVTIKICRTDKGMMAELWRENKILCRVLAATIDIDNQPREETMNYQQAAQSAIDCQNASNLSGVLKSFAGPVMDAIWDEARRTGKGTDWINRHPIVTLFLDKLASLNQTQVSCGDSTRKKISSAYDAVQQIADADIAEITAIAEQVNKFNDEHQQPPVDSKTAHRQLEEAMRKHGNFGAVDSEGWHALDRTADAAAYGKPFPLTGRNPFQLYESVPGWETASIELVTVARLYWKALVQEKLGIAIL